MVMSDHRSDLRVADLRHHLGAVARVLLDELELRVGETTGLCRAVPAACAPCRRRVGRPRYGPWRPACPAGPARGRRVPSAASRAASGRTCRRPWPPASRRVAGAISQRSSLFSIRAPPARPSEPSNACASASRRSARTLRSQPHTIRSPKTMSWEPGCRFQRAAPRTARVTEVPMARPTARSTTTGGPAGAIAVTISDGRIITTNVAMSECGRKRTVGLFGGATRVAIGPRRRNAHEPEACCDAVRDHLRAGRLRDRMRKRRGARLWM